MLSSDTDILIPASLVAGCTCINEVLLSNGLLATNEFGEINGAAFKLDSWLFVNGMEKDTSISYGWVETPDCSCMQSHFSSSWQ